MTACALATAALALVAAAPAQAGWTSEPSPGQGGVSYNPAAELQYLDGQVYVSWTDISGGDPYTSYWNGSGWTSITPMGASGAGRRTDPTVTWDGAQLWGAANDGTDKPVVKWFDGASTWTQVTDPAPANNGTYSLPSLEHDGTDLWLAWQDAARVVQVSTWDGASWTSLASPGGGSGNSYPDLEWNPTTGTMWAAWNEGGTAYVSEHTGGAWTSRGMIPSTSANALPTLTEVNGTMLVATDAAADHRIDIHVRHGGAWHEMDTPRDVANANYSYPDIVWTGSTLWAAATGNTSAEDVIAWTWDGAPVQPIDSRQLRADDATAIAAGATTLDGATTDVNLRFRTFSMVGGQTVTPWVEIQPWGTPFSAACGASVASTTFAGDPVALTTAGQVQDLQVAVTGLTPGTDYHWRACAHDGTFASGWLEDDSAQRFTVGSAGYLTGYEHGALSTAGGGLVTATSGTPPSVEAGSARSGSYGLRCDTTTRCRWRFDAGGSQPGASISFWLRLDQLPSALATLHEVHIEGGTRYARLRLDTAGRIGTDFYDSGDQGITWGPTLEPGRWHHIEYAVDPSASPITTDWRVDGVDQPQVTLASGASTVDFHRIVLDQSAAAGPVDVDISFDDMLIAWDAAAYPLGPATVLGYRPDGVGAHNPAGAGRFTDDDGSAIDAASWQQLDELPMDSVADHIEQVSPDATQSEYVELSLEDSSSTLSALAVRATVAHSASATAVNDGRSAVARADGVESTVFAGDHGQSALQYKAATVTPPAGGWSDGELDALTLRIGYSNDVVPVPQWDAALVEVAYQAPPYAPDALFTDDVDASAGTVNNTAIINDDFRLSWTNTAGEAVDRQRVQVVTTTLDDVVALWHFDGDPVDATGNGHDLVPGAPAEDPSYAASMGDFGQAIDFDGADSATVPHDPAFDLDVFTVDAWVNFGTTGANYENVFEKSDGLASPNERNLTLHTCPAGGCGGGADGRLEATVTTDAGVNEYSATSAAGYRDGEWHHVAVTVGGDGGQLRLFVDGAEVASTAVTGNIDNPGTIIEVGRRDANASHRLSGMIDDLRVTARELTAGEIAGYHATRRPHFTTMWDSDTGDAGVALGSACADAARCADITYGATGSPVALRFDDARYYARAKLTTQAGGAWTAWSGWDWFETQESTTIDTSACTGSALDFGIIPAGIASTTATDCTVGWGSSGSTTQLRVYQSDHRGTAAWSATDGTFDPGWDGPSGTGDGVATFDMGGIDEANVTIIDDEGRILVGGFLTNGDTEAWVMRLADDGTVDPTFNLGNPAVFDRAGGGTDNFSELAIDGEGRILALGQTGIDILLYRLLDDGTPDPSFGGGTGYVVLDPVALLDAPGFIDTRPTGEIVIVSRYDVDDLTVIQLTEDGSYDTDFNGTGIRQLAVSNAGASRPDAVLRADGSLVVTARNSGDVRLFALDSSGSDLATFAGGGDTVIDVTGASESGYEIAEDSQGRLVIGGEFTASPADIGVARFTANGTLDTTFNGGAGWASLDIGGQPQVGRTVGVLPDDRIVVAGRHDNGVDEEWLVARFTADGDLDTTFNGTGYRRFDLTPGTDRVPQNRQLAIAPDGDLVISGSGTNATRDTLVVRLQGSSIADYSPGIADFTTGTDGAFGACLRTLSNATADWTTSATCPASDGAWWSAVPASRGAAGATVAHTTTAEPSATASLRFGARVPPSAASGTRYLAPITIEILDPTL